MSRCRPRFGVSMMSPGIRQWTMRNVSRSACHFATAVAACQLLCGCVSPLRTETEVALTKSHASSFGRQAAQPDSNSPESNSPGSQREVAAAASLMHAGNLPAAQASLVEILIAEPSNSSAVELLAEVSQKRGDIRLQQASLKRLISLRPGSATIANRCGKRLLDSVRMEASINDGRAAGDSSTEQTTSLAIATLARAVELEPRNTLFVQDLFAALINQGMNERAEQVLHEALQQNPRDKVLPMTAARLYESRSEWSSAVFYYDVALRNDPANPVWRRQRAVCHFRQGSFEKAQTDFSRSLAGSPVKPQLSEHLAWGRSGVEDRGSRRGGSRA